MPHLSPNEPRQGEPVPTWMSDGSSFDWMMIDGSTLNESILPKRMRRGMAVSTAA